MIEHDRALEAFHRLLADGSVGGQAKVDALMALAQRTVLVPVWSQANGAFRTLVNSQGQTALPVFTSGTLLRVAAKRFGWLEQDGTVPSTEVGSRAAMRHAVAHNLPYVVVDIASPHALEIDYSEITPLLTPEARRESSGPFAGVGRLSSSMLQAVKATPPPGELQRHRPTPPPPDNVPRASETRSQPGKRNEGMTTPAATNAARAPETLPEPDTGSDDPDELTQTGTRTRPRRTTPLAHVLGERRRGRQTPLRGHKRPSVQIGGSALRESAHPPPMDERGSYGAASRTQRREILGRTPPSGGTRTPFVQKSDAPSASASSPSAPGLRSDAPVGMGASSNGEAPARITPLQHSPSEPLLESASSILRNYPEVEWASFCFAARGDAPPAPAIALRVDAAFRQRMSEIVLSLRTACASEGIDCDVVMLDDTEAIRAARDGVVFYPWRRSPSRPGT